jgi:hypothetical protein
MVTGSTAPIWTALLSTAFLLPGPAEAWAKAFGAGFYLLAIAATWTLARELGVRSLLAGLAAALTATTGWMVWSALSGMEIPLFAFLSLSGMTLHCRERRSGKEIPFSLLVLALAALARPEGLLLIAAATFDRLLGVLEASEPAVRQARIRTLLKGLLLVAIIVVPTMIFYRVIGDGFLPTTYWAKARALQRWAPSGEYLWVVAGIFYRAQPVTTLLALGGLVVLIRESFQPEGRGRLVVALWALGLPLYYSFFSLLGAQVLVGNFGRYYFPMLPVMAVAGVVALDRLIGEVLGRETRVSRTVGVVLVLLAMAPMLVDLPRGLDRYVQTVLNVHDSDVAMARWLQDRLPEEAVLAVNDIGALGYILPNRIIDLAGIGNPEIHDYLGEAFEAGEPMSAGVFRFVESKRPDYLAVFPSWYSMVADEGRQFETVHRVEIPNNVTMGGDELVLYSTPWNRFPLTQR